MISIIVSSHNQKYFDSFSKNVSDTIGVPYEIIQIWNPGIMSISEAYNKGASQAKYGYLVFCHEDIKFISDNWGKDIIDIFSKKLNIGCVGLAGSKKKYSLPTGQCSGIEKNDYDFVTSCDQEDSLSESNIVYVKVIDGVCIFTTNKVWGKIKFNESIHGFHFYDIDYSLRVSKKYKVAVINYLKINHFSKGNFGSEWMKSAIKIIKGQYDFDVPTKKEKIEIRKFWYERLIYEKAGFFMRLRYIFCMGVDFKTGKGAFIFLFKRSH